MNSSISPQHSDDSDERKPFSEGADAANPDGCQAAWFECNICLEPVHDPVVTLCGHLYCWPCIYKWLESPGNTDQPQQCPVCKSDITLSDLIPLYGRGQATTRRNSSESKSRQHGIVVPRRPPPRSIDTASPSSPSPRLPHLSHRAHFPSPAMLSDTTTRVINPIIGLFGGTIHSRVFRNSVTNVYTYPNAYSLEGASPRVRRVMMQADKSLNRISFFLLCCCILCLLLF